MATPLPPGAVSMEDTISGQAGLTVKPQRPVVSQAYEDYVASPLTKMLGSLVGQGMASGFSPALRQVGEKGALLGGPEGMQEAGETVAKFLIPQNTTEAGIAATTLGAGPLVSKIGSGVGRAAARVGAACLGGAAGSLAGEIGGGDISLGTAAKGGAQGLIAGGIGEGIGAGLSALRKMGMERSSAKMSQIDAAQTVESFKKIPKLRGVFNDTPPTPEGIENLVNGAIPDPKAPGRSIGVGEAKLGAMMDQADARIASAIQQKAQQGIQVRFPLVEGERGVGDWGTFEQARGQLTKLGAATRKMNPHKEYVVGEQTLSGAKAKQLYAETVRAFQQQLDRIGPDAVQAFTESRGAYEAGMKILAELPKAFTKMQHNRVAFNTDALHKPIAKNRKDWMNKLGEEGYWELAKALRLTPETMGRKDVMSPTGAMATMAGVLPLPGAAYARFQVGSPGFVGDPLSLGGGARMGLDLAASQGIGRGLDLASPLAQQYGPLVLPGAQP